MATVRHQRRLQAGKFIALPHTNTLSGSPHLRIPPRKDPHTLITAESPQINRAGAWSQEMGNNSPASLLRGYAASSTSSSSRLSGNPVALSTHTINDTRPRKPWIACLRSQKKSSSPINNLGRFDCVQDTQWLFFFRICEFEYRWIRRLGITTSQYEQTRRAKRAPIDSMKPLFLWTMRRTALNTAFGDDSEKSKAG